MFIIQKPMQVTLMSNVFKRLDSVLYGSSKYFISIFSNTALFIYLFHYNI